MAQLRENTWETDTWYGQYVAGDASYSGDNQLWQWGRNNYGQLGLNDTTDYSSPVQVGGSGWNGGMTGNANTGATKADGTLWSWGYGGAGENGQNSRTSYSSPVQIPGTWSSVAGSLTNMKIAVNTSGELYVWGFQDGYGQFGINEGGSIRRSMPVQVPGSWATGYGKCEATGYTAYAIQSDGTLWSWGYNYGGSMGVNIPSGSKRSSPVQVGTGTDWAKLGNLYQSMWAIKTDGTAWFSGPGGYGASGQNNNTQYSSPKQLPGSWRSIASYDDGSVAIKTDGTLWGWGRNSHGQIGVNNRTVYSSPKQCGTGTDWGEILSSSSSTILAVKTDGTAWMWGNGDQGRSGHNNEISYSSPVQVGALTDWRDGAYVTQISDSTLLCKQI